VKTITREGMWCDVCALPSGGFAHVVAERGAVAAYTGADSQTPIWRQPVATDFLRFIRCAAAPDGSVRAIGQAADGRAWFVGPGIAEALASTHGVNPVGLRHDGQQWIAYVVVAPDRYQIIRINGATTDVAMSWTSQGLRDVTPDGTVIFADPTYTGNFQGYVFGEYQRRDGVIAGQGEFSVGVMLEADRHFFRARSGPTAFGVHFARSGQHLAVSALTEGGAWVAQFEPPFPPHEPLAGAAPPPVSPHPTPAPVPPGPPAVTITEYSPRTGTAPLIVVAQGAVTAGVVNKFTWRWRRSGETAWREEPTTERQHTFEFKEAGTYEIGLRGDGPGGSNETGMRREVRVDAIGGVSPAPVIPAPVITPVQDKFVTLRTRSDRYLCAELGTPEGRLVADRLQAGAWETFELERMANERVRLRAANGKYVCAEDGGGRELVANRAKAGAWEEFTVVSLDNDRVALKTSSGKLVSVDDQGVVLANATTVGPSETFTPSIPLLRKFKTGTIAGRLRVDGRFFVNDAGTFRPIFASMLSVLRRSPDATRDVLDWAAQTGFNGIRVFAGALTWAGQSASQARDRLPSLLTEAAARGLYVEVTAITDSKDGGYDPAAHAAAVAAICDQASNAILEVANEPYHPTQTDAVHSPEHLLSLGRKAHVPFALGAASDDESIEMGGGTFVTAHLDRGRDKWNQVRRVRELAALCDATKKPVINNEPIGAGEQADRGRRESDPAFFFCMGALDRIFEVGGVFHSEAGLQAVLPGPVQQACAEAFVAGSRVIPTEDRLSFKNAGWTDSPVSKARFDETIIRAYTGVAGPRAWTVLVGLSGEPGLVLQGGWRTGNRIAERPGVVVLQLER
jgi:hypothetical protein